MIEAAFKSAMIEAGIVPMGSITADGKLRRIDIEGDGRGSLNGWYVLHGDGVPAGSFGSWKAGVKGTWCAKKQQEMTPAEQAEHRQRIEEARRARENQIKADQDNARKMVALMLPKYHEASTNHPYLAKKNVKNFGLKTTPKGELVVPMRDSSGMLHSLQFIDGDGTKRFSTGGRVAGCFHLIGAPTDKIFLCEGYSTGASIHEATGSATAIAFNAGNLAPVAQALREKYPDVEIVICADDDRWTFKPGHKPADWPAERPAGNDPRWGQQRAAGNLENPGIAKAKIALEKARKNARIVTPVFEDISSHPTDFNDLHKAKGIDAVREIISVAQVPPKASGLKTIDPVSLQGLEIPKRKWIVPNWIPLHCTSSLYGDGGTGKSLLAMQLMTAVTLGQEWIGLPTTRVKTWGLFCEDGPAELHIRQNDINRAYDCDFGDLENMRWLSGTGGDNILMGFDGHSGNPLVTEFYQQIEQDVLDFGAQFVLIDTAADTFGGLENSRVHVRQFIGLLTRLAIKIDGAVLFNAHPSVAGMANNRGDGGSTGWNNSVRSRMYFTTPKAEDGEPQLATDERILTRKKANYAPRDEEIGLTWKEGAFVRTHQGGPGGIVAQISKASREKAADEAFLAGLDAAEAQGRAVSWSKNAANFAPKLISKNPSFKGFSQAELAAAMERLFSRGEIKNADYGRGKDSTKKIVRVMPKNLMNGECHGVQ